MSQSCSPDTSSLERTYGGYSPLERSLVMKPVLSLAAAGVVALILWKALAVFLLPLIGVLIGVAFIAIKVVLLVAGICFVIWVFKRMSRSTADVS